MACIVVAAGIVVAGVVDSTVVVVVVVEVVGTAVVGTAAVGAVRIARARARCSCWIGNAAGIEERCSSDEQSVQTSQPECCICRSCSKYWDLRGTDRRPRRSVREQRSCCWCLGLVVER